MCIFRDHDQKVLSRFGNFMVCCIAASVGFFAAVAFVFLFG